LAYYCNCNTSESIDKLEMGIVITSESIDKLEMGIVITSVIKDEASNIL
jgi:hypothetical protein